MQGDEMSAEEKKPRIWHIWRPGKNHGHWEPDEQTYAIEPPGFYNPERFDKIDEAISKEAFELAIKERDEARAEVSHQSRQYIKVAELLQQAIKDRDSWENKAALNSY